MRRQAVMLDSRAGKERRCEHFYIAMTVESAGVSTQDWMNNGGRPWVHLSRIWSPCLINFAVATFSLTIAIPGANLFCRSRAPPVSLGLKMASTMSRSAPSVGRRRVLQRARPRVHEEPASRRDPETGGVQQGPHR